MLKAFLFIIACFQIITAGGCEKMKKEKMEKNVSEENDFVKENIPRGFPFKNVKKHILYIILEFTGGHYNLMLSDRWFYAFMKNMSEEDYVHLIKVDALEAFIYSPNAYGKRSHTWNVRAEHSLSKDEKVLVTKRKEKLPHYIHRAGNEPHFSDVLIEAYDESFFPVLLKYKEIYFALEDQDVNWPRYIFYALNPRIRAYIELEVKIMKNERAFLEHNVLPSLYDQCQRTASRKIFMDDEIWYTSFLKPETSEARIRSDYDEKYYDGTSWKKKYYKRWRWFAVDMKDVTFVTIPFKDAIEKIQKL